MPSYKCKIFLLLKELVEEHSPNMLCDLCMFISNIRFRSSRTKKKRKMKNFIIGYIYDRVSQ
jgi:hypothetical protein